MVAVICLLLSPEALPLSSTSLGRSLSCTFHSSPSLTSSKNLWLGTSTKLSKQILCNFMHTITTNGHRSRANLKIRQNIPQRCVTIPQALSTPCLECDNCFTRTKAGNHVYKSVWKPVVNSLKFIFYSISENLKLFRFFRFSVFAFCNFVLSFFYEAPFVFINRFILEIFFNKSLF